MRRYIFRTPDGQEPDIHFVSASATCEASGSAHDYTCPIQGTMTLQGVPQPIDLHLRVKEESRGVYHASGDAMLKLSAYGIAQPTQFGVKPLDEVKIHLEFTGRGQSRVAEAGGSR
jgi:polyisoprenoid-binding protein YceI